MDNRLSQNSLSQGLGLADTIGDAIDQAIESGNQDEVLRLLDTWPETPSLERNSAKSLWPYHVALAGAVRRHNLELTVKVLDQGISVDKGSLYHASQPPMSTAIFETFIDHGWDINTPISGTEPPCLA